MTFINPGKATFMTGIVEDYYGEDAKYELYDVLDWTNNDLSSSDTITNTDFSTAGFTYKQLMLRTNSEGQTFLRTTSELDDLYESKRYYDKWNLEGFSFDYEYEILPTNQPVTIPKHLLAIANEIDPSQDPYLKHRYTTRPKKIP